MPVGMIGSALGIDKSAYDLHYPSPGRKQIDRAMSGAMGGAA